ncbi:MAG TPA: sigma 54-interacting transcriptional regulator [Polyangia bacterium]|nr:sigma 54-interacting transcriptional regulator [Polyangia bacterium]
MQLALNIRDSSRRLLPGAADPCWFQRACNQLRAEGIALPLEENDGCPTLLVFDGAPSAILEEVATISRGGRVRLFVAAAPARCLDELSTWKLLRAGASDVFCWNDLENPALHIAARLCRWAQVDEAIDSTSAQSHLIGQSTRWLACLRQVVETAIFAAGPVLLLGESGTGKELLARLVHSLDARPDKGEMVVLDCTTVVSELSGSEFFGHERGAFTGAAAERDGAFALADRGTLFLDEVGELPLPLQAQLLRVIQEGAYKRVGSNLWKRTSFRLVCATHRDLREDVAAGRFRNDLYHRIASRICRVPSLRERQADILPLAAAFLQEFGRTNDLRIDLVVQRLLTRRSYPGNVRELRQVMARIADRHVGPGPITAGDVPDDERPQDAEIAEPVTPSFDDAVTHALDRGIGLRDIGRFATDAAIRLAIANENGNLRRAAERLGVTDRALQLRRAQRPDS